VIVWLASYPRSGNTLLRTILRQAFGMPSYSIYDDTYDIGANPQVAALVGHEPLGMPLDRLLEERSAAPGPCLLKTHDAPHPARDTDLAIYVVRDGRAAAVSYLHYLHNVMRRPRVTLEEVILGEHVRFGHWSDHIRMWEPDRRPRTLLVRYEDLIGTPPAAIRSIRDFTGFEPVAEWRTDFETMRRLDPRFFRAGSNERNIAHMAGDAEDLFWQVHGDTMTAMGYPGRR
jgi:hypothetical protein